MIIEIPIWVDQPSNYLHIINNNKDNVDTVIINCLNDIDYINIGGDKSFLQNCLYLCRDYNIPVVLTTMYSEKYNPPLGKFDVPNTLNFTKVEWETYWIYKTFIYMVSIGNLDYNNKLNLNLLDNNVNLNTTFDYDFITLNNLAKYHRCQFMDYLCKYDLISSGAIAWRDVVRGIEHVRHLIPAEMMDSEYLSQVPLRNGYKYRYWKPRKLLLDQTHVHNIERQEYLVKEYNQSFCQIVTETDSDIFIISEKTSVPLLFQKPFIVLSCKHFHKNLKSLGFELYDEIFDYTFDNCDSLEERTDLLVQNLVRIKNMSLEEKTNLFEKVKPKLKHNRQLALKLVFDNIPEKILELSKNESFWALKSELVAIKSIPTHRKAIYDSSTF